MGDEIAVSRINNFGAVELFRRSGNSWVADGEIEPPPETITGQFFGGAGVSYTTNALTVTCHGFSSAATTGSGCVRTYSREGSSWIEAARIEPPSAGTDEFFGLGGAERNDNFMIVGMPKQAADRGAALLYARNGTQWNHIDTVHQGGPGDQAGLSVAISRSLYAVGVQYLGDSMGAVHVEQLPSL